MRDRTGGFLDRAALLALLLAVVVAPLVHSKAARDPYGPPKEAAFAIVLTGVVAALALAAAGRGVSMVVAAALPALICVAGGVSAAFAPSPSLAVEAVRDLAVLAVPAFVAGCVLLRTPRRVLAFANALGVAAVLVSIVGILQHQRLDWWGYRASLAEARAGASPPSPDILAVPFVEPALAAVYGWLDRWSRPEHDFAWAGPFEGTLREVFAARPFARLPTNDGAASVFGHPNVAAEIVAAGFVALAVAARAAWTRARAKGAVVLAVAPLLVRLAGLGAMALYLVMTGTRGAAVALAASACVLAAMHVLHAPPGRRARRLAMVLGCALVAGALGAGAASVITVPGRGGGPPETLLARFGGLLRPGPDPARDTILERRILWANTNPMLDAESGPAVRTAALGVGPGNWQVVYPLHHRSAMRHPPGTYTPNRYADHPHQDPLEFLAEHGLVGLILLSALLGTAVARLAWAMRTGGAGRHAALALLGVLVALASVSLFSFPLHLPVGLVIAFLSIGAALAAGSHDGVPPETAARSSRAWPRVAIAGLLLSGVAALGGARAGAAVSAAIGVLAAAAAAWVPPRAVSIACTAALAAGIATFPALREAFARPDTRGTFDAAVALAGLAAAALSALRLDATLRLGPATSRALAILALLVLAIGVPGAWSRTAASVEHRAGIDASWGARFIPDERRTAEGRARDAFDRATMLNSADFLAEVGRAGALDRSGFLADAEASARRALHVHPWLINARIELAELALKQGRDEPAMREARMARALNPDAVPPHLMMGVLFLRQGRMDLAAEEFEKAVALSPGRYSPDARIRAAEIYLSGGRDVPKALAHLAAAEKDAPSDATILARVARLYAGPGSPPEFQAKAETLWKRVLALNPLDPDARMRVTVSPLLRGEPTPSELEGIVEKLETLMRTNPDLDPAGVRYFRALALERLGRSDDALRAYREVALLTGIAPFRTREDDVELDAAIEALRALSAERAGQESRPALPNGAETRAEAR